MNNKENDVKIEINGGGISFSKKITAKIAGQIIAFIGTQENILPALNTKRNPPAEQELEDPVYRA